MDRAHLAAALAGTALLAGCASSPGEITASSPAVVVSLPAAAGPSPSRSAAPLATPPVTSAPTVPTGPPLTGFGATTDAWASTHTPDPRYNPGAAWDLTPGLGESDDKNDRFYALNSDSGIVDMFSMRFPHGSSQAEATAEAMTTLPADTRVVWKKKFDTCYAIQFQSRTLGNALGDPKIGDPTGGVQFVFNSDEASAGNPTYEPRNVVDAVAVLSTDAKPADFAGC